MTRFFEFWLPVHVELSTACDQWYFIFSFSSVQNASVQLVCCWKTSLCWLYSMLRAIVWDGNRGHEVHMKDVRWGCNSNSWMENCDFKSCFMCALVCCWQSNNIYFDNNFNEEQCDHTTYYPKLWHVNHSSLPNLSCGIKYHMTPKFPSCHPMIVRQFSGARWWIVWATLN